MSADIVSFPLCGPTIVLVCGDGDLLQHVADSLRENDVAVRSASDPLEALAMLHDSAVDAVWAIDTEDAPYGEWLNEAMAVDHAIFPIRPKLFWVSDGGLVHAQPQNRNAPLAGTFTRVPSSREILRLTVAALQCA